MKSWIRYRRGLASYDGAISRRPFTAWLSTPEGTRVLTAEATHARFWFFAKPRATGRLWRRLEETARDPGVVAAVQTEVDAYFGRLQEFAYSAGLPRVNIDLYRLVVVPRVLVNSAACGALARRLSSKGAFALPDGGALRDFFVRTVIAHLDAAIEAATPSPKHPMRVGREWMSVGLDAGYVWRVPMLDEPSWKGHHFVLELTPDPIPRSRRKRVTAAVANVASSLASLSRMERQEILRRAVQGT